MKIAVCDDLEIDRNILKNFLGSFSKENSADFEITEFENGESLLESVKNITFDIIFLDIYMKGQKGIDIARSIKSSYPDIIIIFTTTSHDFAIESYSLNVEGYLVKPFDYNSFKNAFFKHYTKYKSSLDFILINNCDKVPVKIYLSEIIFLEVYSRQCVIHTVDKSIDSKININDLSNMLLSNSFFKVSRNFIINFKHVKEVSKDFFILSDDSKIPIPSRSRTQSMNAYADYLWKSTS